MNNIVKMKHILYIYLICLSSLQCYPASVNRDSSLVSKNQNEIPKTNNSVGSQGNLEIKEEHITSDKNNDFSTKETIGWYNIFAPAAGIIGLIISIYSIRKSSKVSDRNNQLSNEVKKLEIKMRTSDFIVAKRLEVFPKLHVLTDTLGAAIRYYENHITDEDKKEWNTFVLKREIKAFHQKLSNWDANYCIFAGNSLTHKVGEIRKMLEKMNDWDKKEITPDELHDLHFGLREIEHGLKNEMKIHITEDEENN